VGSAGPLALPVARPGLRKVLFQRFLNGSSSPQPGPPSGPLAVTTLREWPGVLGLEREWRDLLARADADPLFLSWEWLSAWHDVVGKTRSPYVVVARDSSGRLLGLAPFYRAKARLLGTLPYRGLRIMADYPTGSEYLDWIVDKEHSGPVFEALARALAQDRGWDFVWLPYCAGWTGASTRLADTFRRAGLHTRTRVETYAAMLLPATFEEYLKSLSRQRREKVRQSLRRCLAEAGCEVVYCTREEDIPRFLDALFDLHSRRWQERGQLGTFRKKPTGAAFYRRFAPMALEKGWLRLAGVVRDGAFLAVQVGYVCDGVWYQMQEGFDLQTPGVGNALRASIIDRSITRDHLTGYDFLAGFSEGKARWGASPRTGHALIVVRPGVRSMALSGIFWPTGRYLRFTDLGQ
jgi:CelD/BcsL family acetyltransferase involved in cellulose biosynthesis